jgi:hypothetical protein
VIEIVKADGGYAAVATPPNVETEWRTTEPMTVKALIAELRRLGAHQTDIGDALYSADPNWLENHDPTA